MNTLLLNPVAKFRTLTLVIAAAGIMQACNSTDAKPADASKPAVAADSAAPAPVAKSAAKPAAPATDINGIKVADAASVLAKPEVPILCYHQVRDWKPTDSKSARDYIVPEESFRAQMKMLADSGYHTILPDQLYAYLNTGAALPSKPVIITFDDTDLDQFTFAKPLLDKYNFKGVFFIMTVSLGRPRYMSKEQVRTLSDEGHAIGSHTWDHHNVKKYQGDDWKIQIEKPSKQLEEITGKRIQYFAYPFGLWNPQAIPELKKRGMVAAFQLYAPRDQQDPLYTIRRIIVPGTWSGATLDARMKSSFGFK
ncbi:polysaccharide deacetylase family protein [Pseudoflavitalea sp. G-6-1-2]|uniref:polysaccharide deacetylase family protein n=1 Tax=Pseudoflavitalea sp. G-6-1-2 TaxID=2728841 RepID=UPI0019816BAC|nr:polysaccharide deacetylase family protein [Pseudoflavitalea sp. G-6-1-2]